MMYDPVTDNFTTYKPVEPKEIKLNLPLFGEIDIPGAYRISSEGTPIYEPNTPETQEYRNIFENMGEGHLENSPIFSNNKEYSKKITTKEQKENALYIMDNLINKGGFKPHEAAGIVGNFMAESSLNTGALNSNDLGLPAGGLAGWRGSNFSRLKQFAKDRGKSWTDIDSQLDFLMSSIDNDVRNRLSKATNPHEASEAWAYYEKYAGYNGTTKTAKKAGWNQERVNQEHKNRSNYANEIYELWKSRKS